MNPKELAIIFADIACGQGYFSEAVALQKHGLLEWISPELIAKSRGIGLPRKSLTMPNFMFLEQMI